MQTTLRWCKDIKMWAIDRPINDVGDVNGSCVHRTSFCDTSCVVIVAIIVKLFTIPIF